MTEAVSLMRMGEAQANAEQANAVARALQAHLMKLDLDDTDRDALQRAREILDNALQASRAVDVPAQIRANLSGGSQTLELIRAAAPEILPDPAQLTRMAEAFAEILAGNNPDTEFVRTIQTLFRQLSRSALEAFRAEELDPRLAVPA